MSANRTFRRWTLNFCIAASTVWFIPSAVVAQMSRATQGLSRADTVATTEPTTTCPNGCGAPDVLGRIAPRRVLAAVSADVPGAHSNIVEATTTAAAVSVPQQEPNGAASETSWRQIPQLPQSVVTPGRRDSGGSAYDEARGQVVLFGGRSSDENGYVQLDDTWTWDGSTWVEQHPTTKPPSRIFTQMAYHAALGKVILFGGASRDPVSGELRTLNGTWAWDGSSWTQLSPATSPPDRAAHYLAHDPTNNTLVLFGGVHYVRGIFVPVLLGDTWLFDGANWNLATPLTTPTPRSGDNSFTYVPANGGLLLFGGKDLVQEYNDTWLWNGSNWTLLLPATSPPARFASDLAFNATTSRAVLFLMGVVTNDPGETWTWDGQDWNKSAAAGPPGRFGSAYVYHPPSERILLFGGAGCGRFEDVWLWDGEAWMEMDLGKSSPPYRTYTPGIAFDTERDEAVLFGGYDGCRFLGDTWRWNGSVWSRVWTAPSPPGRSDTSLAYDAERKLVVLFGGRNFAQNFDDTWVFDGADWTKKNPPRNPPRRVGAVMAYDSVSRKIVLFGGRFFESGSPSVYLDDTWTWDGTIWTEEAPSKKPPGRVAVCASRDTEGRPVVFGGTNGMPLGDTWRWNGATGNWEEVPLGAEPKPSARWAAVMGYDAASQSTVLFGGEAGFAQYVNDTWSFDGSRWSQLTPAASPSARSYAAMCGGSRTNPPVLIGGSGLGTDLNETWTWGLPIPPVEPVTVVSRKTHASAGIFDIPLPLSSTTGVECRIEQPGGNHHVVFSFPSAVTVSDATVTPSGSPDKTAEKDGPPVRSADGKEVTVNLKNVSNAQTVTIALVGVSDGTNTNDVPVQMGVLLGDTTGDGVVDSGDITQTRRQSGQVTGEPNKRIDLSVDGVINSADITLVRRQSGTALPTP